MRGGIRGREGEVGSGEWPAFARRSGAAGEWREKRKQIPHRRSRDMSCARLLRAIAGPGSGSQVWVEGAISGRTRGFAEEIVSHLRRSRMCRVGFPALAGWANV